MAKYAAFGTTLKIGGTAGTAVVNVESIEGPEQSVEMLDMTAHDSGSAYREKVASFIDAGEVSLTIQWDPGHATHKNAAGGLRYLLANRTSSSFAITYPTTPAASDVFTAYVSKFVPSAPFDDKLTAEVTLTLTGAPALA